MPEGRIILGQAVTYLATAPKSNASYTGIDAALSEVRRSAPWRCRCISAMPPPD